MKAFLVFLALFCATSPGATYLFQTPSGTPSRVPMTAGQFLFADGGGLITAAVPTIAQVSGLQVALDARQPLDADLTDLADGSLTGSKVGTGIDATNITAGILSTSNMGNGAPDQFKYLRGDGTWTVPTIAQVSGLQVALDARQPLDADLTDLADGSLTGSKVGTGIDAANITTGILSTARMGTGTADQYRYLRGDGTWTMPAGSSVTFVNTSTGSDATGQLNNSSRPFATLAAAIVQAESGDAITLTVDMSGNQAAFVRMDSLVSLSFTPSSWGSIADTKATAGTVSKTIIGNGFVDIDEHMSESSLTLAPAGITFINIPVLTVTTIPTALSGHAAGGVEVIDSYAQTILATGATGVAPNGNGGAGGAVILTRSRSDGVVHHGGNGTGTGNGGAGGAAFVRYSEINVDHAANGGTGTVAGAGGALTQEYSWIDTDSRTGSSTPAADIKFGFPYGPLTGSSLDIGLAGVSLTNDGDGALTLTGKGNGTDEALTINLDDTPNTVVLSSSTGANLLKVIDMSIQSEDGGGNYVKMFPVGTLGFEVFQTGWAAPARWDLPLVDGGLGMLAVDKLSNSWGDGVRQTFNPNATSAGVSVGASAADPSTLVNGDIWYQSTTNKLRARVNGASIDVGNAGTSGTLGQFAATTSAELAGVLTNETGTGNAVFSASPTFTGTAVFDALTVQNLTSAFTTGINLSGTAPPAELTVGSFLTTSPRGVMSWQAGNGINGSRMHLRKSRGTFAAPATVVTGDELGKLVASGHDGANFLEMGSISIESTGTIAATRVPTKMIFSTATDAAPSVLTPALTIGANQSATFAGQALYADGTALAPAIAKASSPSTGFYFPAAGPSVSNSNALQYTFGGSIFDIGSGISIRFASDAFIARSASRSILIGGPSGGTPLANTLTIGESGVGTNIAGGNGIAQSGAGTGSATGSAFVIRTPVPTGSGTGAQIYADRLTVNATNATFTTGIVSGGNINLPAANVVYWSGRSQIASPADSKLRLQNTGSVTGVVLDFSTDGTLAVRNFGDTAPGNVTAAAGTFSGAITATPSALTGAGAIILTSPATALTTTAPAQALTLADGVNGQIKIIAHVASSGGGTAVLTPTTKTGYTTITFTAVGETATLQYYTTVGWLIISIRGAVAA